MESARTYANRILGFLFCLYLFIVVIQFGCSTNIKEFYWSARWKYEQLNESKPNQLLFNLAEGAGHASNIQYKKYRDIRRPYIELYGICQKHLGKDCLLNDYLVRLNNNQLTFLNPRVSDKDIELYAQKTQHLFNELNRKKIPFLFVMFPYKTHKEAPNLPRGVKDYTNDNADRFLQCLEKKKVPFIDVRQLYIDDPDRHYQLFYSGDHHWKPEYAYESYLYISKILSEQKSASAHFFSCTGMEYKDMKRIDCENPFSIPSQEALVGTSYLNKPEKTTFIIPKAHTDFILECSNLNLEKTGDLQSVFFPFFNPLQPIVHIHNNLVQNDNKVILISDSYSLFFIHFISLNNHNVDYIDPRVYNDDLYEYIQTTHPDIVIFAINPSCFLNSIFKKF